MDGVIMLPRRIPDPMMSIIRPRNTPPARLNVCPAGEAAASLTSLPRSKSLSFHPDRFIGLPFISHFCSTVLAAGMAIHKQMYAIIEMQKRPSSAKPMKKRIRKIILKSTLSRPKYVPRPEQTPPRTLSSIFLYNFFFLATGFSCGVGCASVSSCASVAGSPICCFTASIMSRFTTMPLLHFSLRSSAMRSSMSEAISSALSSSAKTLLMSFRYLSRTMYASSSIVKEYPARLMFSVFFIWRYLSVSYFPYALNG